MTDVVTATGSVATPTPGRYAKQLASHLGRRSEVREEPDGIRLVLTTGECLLSAQDQVLVLRAQAPSRSELDQVIAVVGSHLERFGQRDELRVTWQHG
jgi:hypothetical protein